MIEHMLLNLDFYNCSVDQIGIQMLMALSVMCRLCQSNLSETMMLSNP